MIESRYKIEYILPDDEKKKSSSFKVLWYLLLIPLVLLAVIAITYDFSFQNISRDTSVLVEKAKVHIFNLGEQKHFKNLENQPNKIVEKILIPKPKPIVNSEQKVIIQKVVVKDEKDKKIIIELTEKQKEQQRKIQEQISQNARLSQSLNSLSTELVKEKTKNDSLNSKLSEQEKDRIELEEQLNKILAESENNEVMIEDLVEDQTKETDNSSKSDVANIVKSIEETKINEEKKLAATSEKTEIVEENEEIEIVETVTTLSSSTVKESSKTQNSISKANSNNEPTTIKMADKASIKSLLIKKTEPVIAIKPESSNTENSSDEEGISETDKIIQAMSSIKSNTVIENEKKPIEPSISVEKENNDNEVATEETKPKNNEIIFAIGINTKDEENKQTASDFIPQDKIIKTDKGINNKEALITQKEVTDTETEKPRPSSAVDAIVAAMQESQSNNTNNDNKNIDLELEKEIKQQLVEQGDVSIDN